ncbi:hypothetical protein [Streptomyces sp. 891-h]|uniref:hypothetical protein n=1 Tax=unclassified Streptomyces TaxID=2593676 RepID=UPI001FAAFA71|nr:hypothetical protein [Streptomyces sp. 891-h]UNZ16076.1 hypothetical protein HC362_02165 [Streptomyces sp. 891-h]
MQPSSRPLSPRRSASAVLALVWGALLLLTGAVPATPAQPGAPSSSTVAADRGALHGSGGSSAPVRADTWRRAVVHEATAKAAKTVAHGATATAVHEVRPNGHPGHPPALPTAASPFAPAPLLGRSAADPSQERAPPHSAHDPRTSRGPPRSPLAV